MPGTPRRTRGSPRLSGSSSHPSSIATYGNQIAFHDLFGYPVGIGYPPNWIENPAFYLGADNYNPLQAGMVFHPPLTLRRLGEYGAGFSETLIVTETGAEPLSKLPRQLAAGK